MSNNIDDNLDNAEFDIADDGEGVNVSFTFSQEEPALVAGTDQEEGLLTNESSTPGSDAAWYTQPKFLVLGVLLLLGAAGGIAAGVILSQDESGGTEPIMTPSAAPSDATPFPTLSPSVSSSATPSTTPTNPIPTAKPSYTPSVAPSSMPSLSLSGLLTAQASIMETLYTASTGSWGNSTGWDGIGDIPVCDWFGVTCASDGFVSSIQLEGNNVDGPIPNDFSKLRRLQILDLHRNFLKGTIPEDLFKLRSLENLVLSENELSGKIPDSIGDIITLKSLGLHKNQLTSSIPTSFGNLVNLEQMSFFGNSLTGQIPSLPNLNKIRTIDLGSNLFTGTIPTEYGELVAIRSIYLDGNDIGGSIPETLGNLVNLQQLFLNATVVEGSIPDGLCAIPAVDIQVDCSEVYCSCCIYCFSR